jgi:hypothetical protein
MSIMRDSKSAKRMIKNFLRCVPDLTDGIHGPEVTGIVGLGRITMSNPVLRRKARLKSTSSKSTMATELLKDLENR